MTYLNKKQLNSRIDTFLAKKHQEFPELSLRGSERVAENMGHIIADKLIDTLTHRLITR